MTLQTASQAVASTAGTPSETASTHSKRKKKFRTEEKSYKKLPFVSNTSLRPWNTWCTLPIALWPMTLATFPASALLCRLVNSSGIVVTMTSSMSCFCPHSSRLVDSSVASAARALSCTAGGHLCRRLVPTRERREGTNEWTGRTRNRSCVCVCGGGQWSS